MNNGTFKKGHIPWNKGLKTGVVSPSCFKKGHKTWNTRELFSERIDSKDGYIRIKIAEPRKWILKHRWIYEQHYGGIPAGHVVIFADRDIRNFDINNLILVSRSELARLNQNHLIFDNKEATEAGLATVKLLEKIREIKKNKVGD